MFAAAVPPFLMKTADNPEGPLTAAKAQEHKKALEEDRGGFFDQFTTDFFSAHGALQVTESQRSDAIALFEQGRMDEGLRANIPFAFHPSRQRDEDLRSDYFGMIARAGAAQLVRQNRALMARPDSRPLLPRLRCPLLVACGDTDALTPPECSREIAAAAPHARLELLPDCGHLLTWEQPARVNALLLEWLAALP